MKKVLFIIVALMAFNVSNSQDIIIKKSGDEIKSKIFEVTSTDVKYKNFDNQNGPLYTISKADIFVIKYENGTKEIISDEKPALTANSNDDLFNKGKMDAQRYYDGYKGAGTGTFITGFISPLIGLIPAVACSSTPPKDHNLNYPSPDLMKNTNYYNGYTQKAKKIKQGKVWTNWGIAFGINLVAVIILSTSK